MAESDSEDIYDDTAAVMYVFKNKQAATHVPPCIANTVLYAGLLGFVGCDCYL